MWSLMALPRLCSLIASVSLLLVRATCQTSYIVIIDAGSGGSRAHVYRYPTRVRYVKHLPMVVEQRLTMPEALGSSTVAPGISSFSTHPEDLEAYITPIIEHAKHKILKHGKLATLPKKVPLYLSATAGMRMLDDAMRDKIMKSLRDYFTSSRCPFHVAHHGQVRVLAGEEEGVFGWLSTNIALGTLSANAGTTYGALDLGGASAQISFIPEETSVLSNMFTMHFGNFSDGPIHLYTHSFLQYGSQVAFANSAKKLADISYDSQSVDHPCLPWGVLWNTTAGQYGVSTSSSHIERKNGSMQIRGTGNFYQCRALARTMMYRNLCPVQPCSILSEYQPRLGDSKFLAFGEYAEVFALLNISADSEKPVLDILQKKLKSWCRMSIQEQSAATSWEIGTPRAKLELNCWMGTWLLEFLTSGLGFPKDTRNIKWGPDIDWTHGQALYEVNFFPFVISANGAVKVRSKGILTNDKRATMSDSNELLGAAPVLATAASTPSFLVLAASGLTIFAAGFVFGRADRRRAIDAPEVSSQLLVK